MPERYRKECRGAVLKDGIALKGDYSFDELEAWIEQMISPYTSKTEM